jgi:hypothetical protein
MSSIKGKTVAFTGKLKEMSRLQADNVATQLGAIVVNTVNSELRYLVVGERAGPKLKAARKLKIRILSEADWMKIARPRKPKIAGHTITFDGELSSMPRSSAKRIAALLGARVKNNLTEDVAFVITARESSEVVSAAQKIGTRVLSEAEWLEIAKPVIDRYEAARRSSEQTKAFKISVRGRGMVVTFAWISTDEGRQIRRNGMTAERFDELLEGADFELGPYDCSVFVNDLCIESWDVSKFYKIRTNSNKSCYALLDVAVNKGLWAESSFDGIFDYRLLSHSIDYIGLPPDERASVMRFKYNSHNLEDASYLDRKSNEQFLICPNGETILIDFI